MGRHDETDEPFDFGKPDPPDYPEQPPLDEAWNELPPPEKPQRDLSHDVGVFGAGLVFSCIAVLLIAGTVKLLTLMF